MDFLFSILKNIRLPAVSSLSTTFGDSHKGNINLYEETPFWWTGSKWLGIDHKPILFLPEILSNYDSLETDINYRLCDDSITVVSHTDFGRVIGVQNGLLGRLGMIGCIGRLTQPAGDLALWEGLRVYVVAKEGAWFNIKNNFTLPQSLEGKAFPIETGQGDDIYCISMAVFRFDKGLSKWRVESYVPAHWTARYTFAPVDSLTSPIIKTIDNLPWKGYYHFDVFVKVHESNNLGEEVPVSTSRMLEVLSSIQNPLIIDYGIEGGVFERSLQGSGIINVDSDGIVYIRITLPNGYSKHLDFGYVHFEYLGQRIKSEVYV